MSSVYFTPSVETIKNNLNPLEDLQTLPIESPLPNKSLKKLHWAREDLLQSIHPIKSFKKETKLNTWTRLELATCREEEEEQLIYQNNLTGFDREMPQNCWSNQTIRENQPTNSDMDSERQLVQLTTCSSECLDIELTAKKTNLVAVPDKNRCFQFWITMFVNYWPGEFPTSEECESYRGTPYQLLAAFMDTHRQIIEERRTRLLQLKGKINPENQFSHLKIHCSQNPHLASAFYNAQEFFLKYAQKEAIRRAQEEYRNFFFNGMQT